MKKNIRICTSNFQYFKFIKTHLNDVISSIDIFDDLIIFGTIMGEVKITQLEQREKISNLSKAVNQQSDNKIFTLVEQANENILGVSFENNALVNVCIGDHEIYRIDISGNLYEPNFVKIMNYPDEFEHEKYCESCFCICKNNQFLKVNTASDEDCDSFQISKIKYENKSLKNFQIVVGYINISNFSVPFDFDGDYFVWLDNLPNNQRKLSIFSTLNKKLIFTFDFNPSFGHISFIKFINKHLLFLVRNLYQCEIRKIENNFQIVDCFKHIGNEVIAVDVYINGSKETEEPSQNTYNNSHNNTVDINKLSGINKLKSNKSEILQLNSNVNNNNDFNKDNGELSFAPINNKSIDYKNIIVKDNFNCNDLTFFKIATLDVNGNFNIYINKKEHKLFNFYDINDIDLEYKQKRLFESGFPYYITFNSYYFCITSDHGLFIFNNELDITDN